MYEKKFLIGASDVDPFLDLRLSSLLRFIQDAAIEHAELLGIGKNATLSKDLFWVVTRYSISIYKTPKYLDEIVIKTYPGKDMKFIFPRFFQIENLNGDVLARASSTWVVLNKKDHTINMNPFDGYIPPSESIEGEERLCNKITIVPSKKVEDREVRYSEMDLNAHLNNTKYVDFILDIHSLDYYKTKRIKHFSINYNHEIKAGETISLSNTLENEKESVYGDIGNVNIFSAEIIYSPRE